MNQQPRLTRGDGQDIHAGEGVVPILLEIEPRRLKVVGTGFYITRYGLVATAKHVIEEFMSEAGEGLQLKQGFVPHLSPNSDRLYLRPIRKAFLLSSADAAVLQADNFIERTPVGPLMNLRAQLSARLPMEGARLLTFAYPENAVLDFTAVDAKPTIRGDYFLGRFRRFVPEPEHPFLRFPYFESSIEIRSGASGGPVFNASSRVIGINCRGWDFRGAEHEGDNLSYLVPTGHLLQLAVDLFQLPPQSWEAAQLPNNWRNRPWTIGELARHGHVVLD
jgi:hypothetical protein